MLLMALEGRIELLKSIFGDAKANHTPRKMTPAGFRAFAASHNRRYASRGGGRRSRGD